MTTNIVIAHYAEDLSWINDICQDVSVHVYSKGPECLPPPVKYIGKLSNVGRESHTYVHHIIENYDNLNDVTLFLQGSPFDHLPCGGIEQLVLEAKSHPSGLSQHARVHNVGNNSAYFGFNIHQHAGKQVVPFRNNLVFGEWLNLVCKIKYQNSPKWYIGACFAATRHAIRSVPLETWQEILSSLEYDVNPVTGHYMERAWYMILDQEKLHMRRNKGMLL